jgi:hypothetical protein
MIFGHGIIISSREGNIAIRTYNKLLQVYKLDTHVFVYHNIIYKNDQENATA